VFGHAFIELIAHAVAEVEVRDQAVAERVHT
jgi:hypothetical protein